MVPMKVTSSEIPQKNILVSCGMRVWVSKYHPDAQLAKTMNIHVPVTN